MTKILVFSLAVLLSLNSCGNSDGDSQGQITRTNVRLPAQHISQVDTDSVANPEIMLKDTMPPDTFPMEMLLGRVNPAKDTNFVKIASHLTTKTGIYMRRQAYDAFVKMHAAAKKAGVNLKIVSATRPFNSQKGIWEAKWTGTRQVEGQNLAQTVPDPKERALKILRFSSMPGTSRHHWGTDIDLNNLNNSWFEKGEGLKVYQWLSANAQKFGFCQPYSPMGEDRPNGYQEEKWHWSYMPLSSKYLKAYLHQIEHTHIHGFHGSESAEIIDVIENYVGGISPACLNW